MASSLIVTTLIPALFPTNLSGVWEIDVRNAAASEQVMVNLYQDGSVLTGSYVGSYQVSEVKGQLDGKEVTFAYMIDGHKVVFIGRLVGKSLSGTYHVSDFDQGLFTGRRVSPS